MTEHWPQYSYFKTNKAYHHDVYKRLSAMRKALSELQEKSKLEEVECKNVTEKKIQKIKDETEQEWREKLLSIEETLEKKQKELSEVQKENIILKEQLQLKSLQSSSCQCSKNANRIYSQINGTINEDEKAVNFQTKSSIPTKETIQDCDRLQGLLMDAEQKADQLNLLLNQKLIELNKLQLTLSKQTKEMILLERAYFQLRCHLSKRGNKTFSSQFSTSSKISPTVDGIASKSTSSASTLSETPY